MARFVDADNGTPLRSPLELGRGAVGPVIIETSFDMTGDYSNAFLIVAAALLLIAVIASQIRNASV